jgi:hypothetical protein
MSGLADKVAHLRLQLEDAAPAPGGRKAPEERGERLATIARSDSEELRVTWDSYEGRPYLSLRFWTRGTDGQWWPDKAKGLTVRRHELPAFAEGLEKALERAAAIRADAIG